MISNSDDLKHWRYFIESYESVREIRNIYEYKNLMKIYFGIYAKGKNIVSGLEVLRDE